MMRPICGQGKMARLMIFHQSHSCIGQFIKNPTNERMGHIGQRIHRTPSFNEKHQSITIELTE